MINIPDTLMTTDGYTPHKFIDGFVKDWENYINWADAIVVATTHDIYNKLSNFEVKQETIIFDPRRFFSESVISSKQNYLSLG